MAVHRNHKMAYTEITKCACTVLKIVGHEITKRQDT